MSAPPARATPNHPPALLLLRALDLTERGARGDALKLVTLAERAALGAPWANLASAQLRFALGDGDGAYAALDRAAAAQAGGRDAGSIEAWRAVFLREDGRLSAALAVLDALASREENAASAHALAAEICEAAHDVERALGHVDAALAKGPGVAARHLQRARLLAAMGRSRDARDAIAAACDAEPPSAAMRVEAARRFMDVGAFDDAEAALSAATHGAGAALARAELGRLLLWRGDLDVAAALADAALADDAELGAALCLRGAIHVLRGEHDAALAPLDRAVARDPSLDEAFVWRAEARYHAGPHLHGASAVLEDLERASSLVGDYFAAHALRLLVTIRASGGAAKVKADSLESVHDGVLALVPESAAALATEDPEIIAPVLLRALAALHGNRSPTITTVRALDDAGGRGARRLVHVPVPVTARFAAKWTLERVQVAPLAEVLQRFDGVLAQHPRSSKPWCYRGELRLWIGDVAGARDDFDRAIALDPSTRWAYIGLAATALLEARPDDAIARCAQGVAVAGEGPSMFVYRGEAHRLRGDLDAAAADLTHACALGPSRVSAWVNLALVQGARGDADGLRATMDRLAWQAPSLLRDAARHAGAGGSGGGGGEAVLLACLRMMRGNRSSTCVTYFVGDELRVAPFVAREGRVTASRMLAALRASLERRARAAGARATPGAPPRAS